MSFSRPFDFNPTTGHVKQTKHDVPSGSIGWTSFEFVALKSFLDAYSQADEFRVGVTNNSGQDYLTLEAYEDGLFKDVLVGDYPCPEDCFPPAFVNYSFDRGHVEDVMDVQDCELINVHRCKRRISTEFLLYCIYAVKQVDSNWVALDQPGDPVYVTEP